MLREVCRSATCPPITETYPIQSGRRDNQYRFNITGDLNLPAGGIIIRNFNGGAMPSGVSVNGRELTGFTGREISVTEVPAEVIIRY
jgi:hypothetical protein